MQQMQGGSLIGKGAYGCVFRPTLLCKGDGKGARPYKSTGELTKVSDTRDAEREIEMGAEVQKIPLWKNYFSPVLESCGAAGVGQQTDADVGDCDIMQDKPASKLSLLSMQFSGESIVQYDLGKIDTVEKFWKFGKHLLEAVALLTLNGLIHRDMHRGNVLVDKYGIPRLIDFGISLRYNDPIKQVEDEVLHEYDPHYTQEPPEVNWWVLDAPEKKVGDLLEKKPSAANARSTLGVTMKEQEEGTEELFTQSRSFKERNFAEFWRLYWSKYDAWSVGGVLTAVLKNIQVGPHPIKVTPQMKTVMRGLLEVNPNKRWDAVRALAEWDAENLIIARYGARWLAKVRK